MNFSGTQINATTAEENAQVLNMEANRVIALAESLFSSAPETNAVIGQNQTLADIGQNQTLADIGQNQTLADIGQNQTLADIAKIEDTQTQSIVVQRQLPGADNPTLEEIFYTKVKKDINTSRHFDDSFNRSRPRRRRPNATYSSASGGTSSSTEQSGRRQPKLKPSFGDTFGQNERKGKLHQAPDAYDEFLSARESFGDGDVVVLRDKAHPHISMTSLHTPQDKTSKSSNEDDDFVSAREGASDIHLIYKIQETQPNPRIPLKKTESDKSDQFISPMEGLAYDQMRTGEGFVQTCPDLINKMEQTKQRIPLMKTDGDRSELYTTPMQGSPRGGLAYNQPKGSPSGTCNDNLLSTNLSSPKISPIGTKKDKPNAKSLKDDKKGNTKDDSKEPPKRKKKDVNLGEKKKPKNKILDPGSSTSVDSKPKEKVTKTSEGKEKLSTASGKPNEEATKPTPVQHTNLKENILETPKNIVDQPKPEATAKPIVAELTSKDKKMTKKPSEDLKAPKQPVPHVPKKVPSKTDQRKKAVPHYFRPRDRLPVPEVAKSKEKAKGKLEVIGTAAEEKPTSKQKLFDKKPPTMKLSDQIKAKAMSAQKQENSSKGATKPRLFDRSPSTSRLKPSEPAKKAPPETKAKEIPGELAAAPLSALGNDSAKLTKLGAADDKPKTETKTVTVEVAVPKEKEISKETKETKPNSLLEKAPADNGAKTKELNKDSSKNKESVNSGEKLAEQTTMTDIKAIKAIEEQFKLSKERVLKKDVPEKNPSTLEELKITKPVNEVLSVSHAEDKSKITDNKATKAIEEQSKLSKQDVAKPNSIGPAVVPIPLDESKITKPGSEGLSIDKKEHASPSKDKQKVSGPEQNVTQPIVLDEKQEIKPIVQETKEIVKPATLFSKVPSCKDKSQEEQKKSTAEFPKESEKKQSPNPWLGKVWPWGSQTVKSHEDKPVLKPDPEPLIVNAIDSNKIDDKTINLEKPHERPPDGPNPMYERVSYELALTLVPGEAPKLSPISPPSVSTFAGNISNTRFDESKGGNEKMSPDAVFVNDFKIWSRKD